MWSKKDRPCPYQSFLENAGASHRIGVEAEARYAIGQGLNLTAAFGWVEAQYDQYNDPVTGDDYEGNTVFGIPVLDHGNMQNGDRISQIVLA